VSANWQKMIAPDVPRGMWRRKKKEHGPWVIPGWEQVDAKENRVCYVFLDREIMDREDVARWHIVQWQRWSCREGAKILRKRKRGFERGSAALSNRVIAAVDLWMRYEKTGVLP